MTDERTEGDIEHELELVRREADAGVAGAQARWDALQAELDGRSRAAERVPAPQSGKAEKPEPDPEPAPVVVPEDEPDPVSLDDLPPPPAEKFHATHPDSVIIDSVPPAEAVKPTRRPRKS